VAQVSKPAGEGDFLIARLNKELENSENTQTTMSALRLIAATQ